MNQTIVRAENISKIFHNGVEAVKNVSLELEKNHFYAIMGHSGSGKTTFLQILGLLDNCSTGALYIDGYEVSKLKESQKADIRMKKIGFVFQSYYLNEKMKAFENVMLPMYINSELKKDKKGIAIALLEKLGLNERIHHYPKELSGGEQQRVAIARALANNPDCIFADEPTGNLDADNEVIVFDILKKLSKEGKCVLVVSHNDIVKKYADTIIYMDKAHIRFGDNNEI